MRYTLIFSAFLFLCLSCQSNSQATDMAKDVCGCFKPLTDISDEVQYLIKNNKGSEAELLLPDITIYQEQGQACAASLVDKYGAETEIDVDAVKASMKKRCPKILDTMGPSLFRK